MTKFNSRRFASITIAAAILLFMTFTHETASSAAADAPPNPLTAEWTGPYGGLPPFDKVKIADIKPALETAMAENLAEIDKIANDPAPPTFENTIVALERSGKMLGRVGIIFSIWSNNMNTDEFAPIDAEMQPKLAAHYDKITQNEALFKRIEAVYNTRETALKSPEQKRLVWVYYTNEVHAGARLDAAKRNGCPRSISNWPNITPSSRQTCWRMRAINI